MRILVVSDLHAPYHHPLAFEFLRKARRQYKTELTICIGDEIDAHAWSNYSKSPNAYGAADELKHARNAFRELMRFDKNILFCKSNHMLRAYKRIAEIGVPQDFVRPWGEVIGAPPGWQWADCHEVDGIRFFHGEGYSGAQANLQAALDSRTNCVIGHLHGNAGVAYSTAKGGTVWGLSVGCLIDFRCPVFDYGRQSRSLPVIGCGVVTDGIPHFVPMRQ